MGILVKAGVIASGQFTFLRFDSIVGMSSCVSLAAANRRSIRDNLLSVFPGAESTL